MFFPARMMTELFVSEFFGRRLCVWVVNSCKDYVNVALSFTIRIHAMLCGLQWFAGEDRGAIQKEATPQAASFVHIRPIGKQVVAARLGCHRIGCGFLAFQDQFIDRSDVGHAGCNDSIGA